MPVTSFAARLRAGECRVCEGVGEPVQRQHLSGPGEQELPGTLVRDPGQRALARLQ
jgi:hypothetical protein